MKPETDLSPAEILYRHYAEHTAGDSPETAGCFAAVEHLCSLLPSENREQAMQIICTLTELHEKEAFFAGLRTGSRLASLLFSEENKN